MVSPATYLATPQDDCTAIPSSRLRQSSQRFRRHGYMCARVEVKARLSTEMSQTID